MDTYGLIGRTLGHSWSRRYFTDKFASEGTNACYLNFEMPDLAEGLRCLLDTLDNLRGFNVTIPYKRDIIPLLDRLDNNARAIGAVNTVKVTRVPGRKRPLLTGYNTDEYGFVESLRPFLSPECSGRHALVLGTGGASRAVCHGLRRLGMEPLLVSRRPGEGIITYDALIPGLVSDCPVVVNTTPLGMWPDVDAMPPLSPLMIGAHHICYDLIYNPEPTRWLAECAARGAKVCGGLKMLVGQAEAAWKIWTTPAPGV